MPKARACLAIGLVMGLLVLPIAGCGSSGRSVSATVTSRPPTAPSRSTASGSPAATSAGGAARGRRKPGQATPTTRPQTAASSVSRLRGHPFLALVNSICQATGARTAPPPAAVSPARLRTFATMQAPSVRRTMIALQRIAVQDGHRSTLAPLLVQYTRLLEAYGRASFPPPAGLSQATLIALVRATQLQTDVMARARGLSSCAPVPLMPAGR
jgi:hypothetical protein